ncbi:MAG: hypothetical protein K2X38_09995 [Gemmataceae bacterium]|nr:hypothetical protein [Gemmataceae bacterium]
MAMGIGFVEMLIILLLSGGTAGDIASMLPTEAYLKHRQIESDVDSLMAWATKEPSDPKTQLAQLVAMRRIGEQGDAFSKSPKAADHRQTLARIAEGKLAADKTGFAAIQAAKTLAAIDGKKLPESKMPADIAEQAWTYFPKNSVMAGFAEVRAEQAVDAEAKVIQAVMKSLTDRERGEMFAALEMVGNMRIDRAAFAVMEDGDTMSIIRITGKANPEWILKAGFRGKDKGTTKLKNGVEVHFVGLDNVGSMAAIVGDSDFLLVNATTDRNKNRLQAAKALLEKMLEDAGKDNPANTTFKEDLKSIPKNAVAAIVGRLPEEAKKGLGDKAPESMRVFATRSPQGLGLDGQATMASPDAAKVMAEMALMLRKQALDGVAQMQGIQMPGMNIGAITATLQSMQVQGNGARLSGQVLIHPDVFSSAPMMFFGRQQGLQPVPPR